MSRAPILAEGTVLAGHYQVRRALYHTPGTGPTDFRLYLVMDDAGDKGVYLRVLLLRPAGAAPDLRLGPDWANLDLVADVIDTIELTDGAHDDPAILGVGLVLAAASATSLAELGPAHGGASTQRQVTPARNDALMAQLIALLGRLLRELDARHVDLSAVTLDGVLLGVVSPGAHERSPLRYCGPLPARSASATESDSVSATWARLRDELMGPQESSATARSDGPAAGRQWTAEFTQLLDDWRNDRTGKLDDVMAAATRMFTPANLSVRVGIESEAGPYRRANEDAALWLAESASAMGLGADGTRNTIDWTLIALADGMGGHRDGRIASQLAVHTMAASIVAPGAETAALGRRPRWEDNASVARLLANAVLSVHNAVGALATPGENRAPGCTLTAGLLVGRRLFLAHVGDSRAYLLRDAELSRLTRDDTQVQDMVDCGELTPEQARVSPLANIVTQSIGQSDALSLAVIPRLISPGDRLLLCCDGLTESLDDSTLATILAEPASPRTVATKLVAAAIAAGSHDNVTAVVADFAPADE